MTQKQIILAELNRGGWFSLGDALNLHPPIYALSQRIGELKKMGYEIEDRRVPGHPYKAYRLKLADATVVACINNTPAFHSKPVEPNQLQLF